MANSVQIQEKAFVVEVIAPQEIAVIVQDTRNVLALEGAPTIEVVNPALVFNQLGGDPVLSVSAGENLGYPRVVTLSEGKAVTFDPTASVQGNVLGITLASVLLGETASIRPYGEYRYVGWGLTPNAVHYCTAAGLVSTIPPSAGVLQPIGLALDADTLLLNRTTAIGE